LFLHQGNLQRQPDPPKAWPTPSFIFDQTFLVAMFVAQLAHFIIRRPMDEVSIAAAAVSFVVIVLIIFKFAGHYRRLCRPATGQAS
jgi:hypothetical protein